MARAQNLNSIITSARHLDRWNPMYFFYPQKNNNKTIMIILIGIKFEQSKNYNLANNCTSKVQTIFLKKGEKQR